jgi:hypothetical protein
MIVLGLQIATAITAAGRDLKRVLEHRYVGKPPPEGLIQSLDGTPLVLTVGDIRPPSGIDLLPRPDHWTFGVKCPGRNLRAVRPEVIYLNRDAIHSEFLRIFTREHPALMVGDFVVAEGLVPEIPTEGAKMHSLAEKMRATLRRIESPDFASIPRLRRYGATDQGLMFNCLAGYQESSHLLNRKRRNNLWEIDPYRALLLTMSEVAQGVCGHVYGALAITEELRKNRDYRWAADLARKLADFSWQRYETLRDDPESPTNTSGDHFMQLWAMFATATSAQAILEAATLRTKRSKPQRNQLAHALKGDAESDAQLVEMWSARTSRRLRHTTVPDWLKRMTAWVTDKAASKKLVNQYVASMFLLAIETSRQAQEALRRAELVSEFA